MISFTLGTRWQKQENNIIVDDKEYVGMPGLWELIVATTPDDNIFNNGDYDNYTEIMHSTDALKRNNDESETKPKANKSCKWKHKLETLPEVNEQVLILRLEIPRNTTRTVNTSAILDQPTLDDNTSVIHPTEKCIAKASKR